MWAAYFQADDEIRFTIATKRHRHTAEFEMEKFIQRMTNPEVGVWFCWVEETECPTESMEEISASQG
jgi:hypothetical protein